jgi:hypothetical protein
MVNIHALSVIVVSCFLTINVVAKNSSVEEEYEMVIIVYIIKLMSF